MSKITRIKGYDDYGYEVMDTYLPTMDEAIMTARQLGEVMANYGISAEEAGRALKQLSDRLAEIQWAHTEITAIKDSLDDLRYTCDSHEHDLICRTDALEVKLDDLRSALNEKTENPKQKDDLEIFNRIEENPFLPGFIDLDSEAFLNQRTIWDFKEDWHGK